MYGMRKWESDGGRRFHCDGRLRSMWLGSSTVGHQEALCGVEGGAFLCLLRKVWGPIKVHVDNKGRIDRQRKGEKECTEPGAGDADLWIKIWEELHELVKRGISVEVERVKAHRTKKEKGKMTKIVRFVTEGNEKADELAKAGAMLDEGFMAEARAETMRKEREEVVYVALHCVGWLPLFSGGMERL